MPDDPNPSRPSTHRSRAEQRLPDERREVREDFRRVGRLQEVVVEPGAGRVVRRALALDPEILFLDEPTAGLDPIGASAFDRLIVTLRDALNLSVFLVTHDLDTLHACCDRVAVLAERRVLTAGTKAQMLDVDDPWVHEYFHGPRARAVTGKD